jgi:hypothetical protein
MVPGTQNLIDKRIRYGYNHVTNLETIMMSWRTVCTSLHIAEILVENQEFRVRNQ